MAPLSRELVGVIFEHQYHGIHLNSKKETTDTELEKRNFAFAGKGLASLFDSMPERGRSKGGFDVDARWLDPPIVESEIGIPKVSES